MKQVDIARKLGRSPATVYRWINRLRKVGPEDALKLEEITGVDRRAWIWPDQYPNPVMDKLRKANRDNSTGGGPTS